MKYRQRYERLGRSVPMRALDPKIQIIFKDFGDFFKEFPDAQKIEVGPFMLWFKGFKHPTLKNESVAVYDALMRDVMSDVDPALEQGLMTRLVAASTAYDVADMISKFNEGGEVDLRSRLNEAITEFDKLVDRKVKSPQVMDAIEDLLHAEQNDIGMHWRLPCLNQHIKPLQPGDFVVVAARPDKGKTTFCSSELTHMASQVDALFPGEKRSILWLNNEGPGRKIVMRNFQSALNATTEDLVRLSALPADAEFSHYKTKVRQDYAAALGGRPGVLRVMDVHDFWNHEVEDILRAYKPALVVFDMIDNIKFGGDASNNGQRTDQLLEAMYQWARLMGVKYDCSVIACSQISADGDGQQWPSLSMLKDSKTGKQGAADVIITLGAVNDPSLVKSRYIGTTKNKKVRTGVPGSPMKEVFLDSDRGRYTEFNQ
jgi:replicative DNA helicase